MRLRHRLRRFRLVVLIALVSVVPLGCGIPYEFFATPEGRILREDVIGTWENSRGQTIEFRDDHTYTALGDTFGPGEGQEVTDGRLDGTWDICDGIEELEEQEAGDPTGFGECTANSAGYWVTMDSPGTWQGYMVVSFDEGIRLYMYTPEEGRHDDDFYTRPVPIDW
ncbi:hypothetical protein NOSIN_17935 [Nocardiopsis sinuspersici]|uniref:Uncharacterized protein n=2 Tax=Nocardiopsidaceae TaxID=83676 RepID=A0A1V3C448_9ACTN|nr:hypothetical protein NOSIN_17935 [Nocardiopsis sinuspersici]